MIKIFIAFILFPLSLLLSQSNSEKPFPFTKIGPNLYKIEVDVNSIIVSIGPDGILLCDVGGESKGARVMATVRKLGGEKIDYIINTHWHVDHTGGNICFGKEALIIAHENVRKRLSEDKYLKFWNEEHPAFPEYALPDIVFTDRMTIHFNGEDIELIYLPGGHTDGDVVVYFRQSNILHIGDCLFSNGFPAIDFEMGGSVEGFADNLKKIAPVMPSDVRIIAGHGPDYTIKRLKTYETMIRSSMNAVRDAMQKDMNVEAMQQANILEEWEDFGNGFFSCDEWINMIYQSLIYRPNLDSKTSKQLLELKGPYLGQKTPGMKPELFAPGILKPKTGKNGVHSSPSFSSDGKEVYFTVMPEGGPFLIKYMKMEEGIWSEPDIAPFTREEESYNSLFANSDDMILFKSKSDRYKSNVLTLWQVERKNGIWGKPHELDYIFNGLAMGVSITDTGTIYFTQAKQGPRSHKICKSQLKDGKYQEPEELGSEINGGSDNWQPFIALDESYLIFGRYVGKPKEGVCTLYISFKKPDGTWTKAQSMGKSINNGNAAWPYVSPDGKYFFFVSDRNRAVDKDCMFWQIYWISAKIIEELRPKDLK